MENHCFFGTMLESLGFSIFGASTRIIIKASGTGEDAWEGWSPVVNIVTVSPGQKCVLDVGSGCNAPIQPLLFDLSPLLLDTWHQQKLNLFVRISPSRD